MEINEAMPESIFFSKRRITPNQQQDLIDDVFQIPERWSSTRGYFGGNKFHLQYSVMNQSNPSSSTLVNTSMLDRINTASSYT